MNEKQRVVWWQGPSSGRLTAKLGTVLETCDGRVRIDLDEGSTRLVPIERVQAIRNVYVTCTMVDHIEREHGWGDCEVHAEITEDLFSNRSIYEFANGNLLWYDRSHWFDEYGSISTLAYCEFRWLKHWHFTSEEFFESKWNDAKAMRLSLDRQVPAELHGIEPWKRWPVQSAL